MYVTKGWRGGINKKKHREPARIMRFQTNIRRNWTGYVIGKLLCSVASIDWGGGVQLY